MAEQNCKYFLEHKGDDKRIYTFLGNLYCDNLSCKEQVGGKAQQYEADSNWARKCKIGELLSDPKKSESVGKLVGVVADSKECPI